MLNDWVANSEMRRVIAALNLLANYKQSHNKTWELFCFLTSEILLALVRAKPGKVSLCFSPYLQSELPFSVVNHLQPPSLTTF